MEEGHRRMEWDGVGWSGMVRTNFGWNVLVMMLACRREKFIEPQELTGALSGMKRSPRTSTSLEAILAVEY